MKKLIFLFLLLPFLSTGQVANGTETKQNAFRSLNPQTVTNATGLTTMGTDGTMGKIAPINVNIPYSPINYSAPNQTIGNHLSGIDTRLGQISSTSAGLTQRVWFTADNTTVTAGTFFASNPLGKGATATGSPTALVLGDNVKAYFNKDLISAAQPSATIGYAGTYSGNLTVSATPTPNATQQRFTLEVYRCDNGGTPIASGVSGAPTGDLGVTVIAILDSGLVNLVAGSISNVPISGVLSQNITINTGERLRYHVSAQKVGTGGGNVTFGVYYGSSYNSYYDVPVAITTDAVLNKSAITGVTSTDALNYLNTNKENKQSYIKYADDYANLTDAINATPMGGTLILGNHTYTGNISITRASINIVGSKMPSFHATLDQLVGGTIINGPFIIDGNNVSISNLGIDSGTAQCIALNSGNPMEGLVMHNIAATDLNFNNNAENVIAIVKANTTMHALLFEGLANSTFRNVHGKGGDFGVVFKVSDSNASEIYGYESRTTNVYIKSDSYAPCLRSNFNNINSLSNAVVASQPVAVHASTSNLFDVNVNNVNIYGGTRQFRLISHPATTPTHVMSNVNVSNVVMENGVDVGLDCYGVVYNTAFNNILVRNTVSGQGVFSDFNGRGINFNNVRFDDNSGNNLDTAIDIRSYSVLNNIVSIRNTDQTSLGGINLNNFANSSKIGIYVGNLKINGVSVNRDKLTGQGTSNYVPKYDTAGILKNSLFLDDGLNSSFNAPIYTLGAGWSIFSTGNTTGSGFLTQVNSVPALRSTSSSTNSSINELRNLSLNFGTNGTTRLTITGSGDASFTNTLTVPNGTTSNHAVNKSQLDLKADIASPTFTGDPKAPTPTVGDNDTSIATTAFVMNHVNSGTYTPTLTAGTNVTAVTLQRATYTRIGNIVTVEIGIDPVTITNANVNSSITISLPFARATTNSYMLGSGTFQSNTPSAAAALVQGDTTTTVKCYFIPLSNTNPNFTGGISFQYNVLD